MDARNEMNNARPGRRGGYKSYPRSRNGLVVPRSTAYRLRRNRNAAQNMGNAPNEIPGNANRDQPMVIEDNAVIPNDEVGFVGSYFKLNCYFMLLIKKSIGSHRS